ncbi:MAG: hypothetical protein H6R16_656 [Proteobacteria bacterium]|nr:hypothetical protein [Pseudomonadota bacterium]
MDMRRYYEFAFVIILIGLMSLLLMRSLEATRVEVEEAIVQSEVAAIRIGLVEAVAHREGFGGELPKSKNPLDWVSVRPANYVGELDVAPENRSVWYFDRPAGELVFRFRDGHRARFRFSRELGSEHSMAVLAGVGLSRLEDQRE